MSNYQTFAIRPSGTEEEPVVMLDNHFGKHRYGVMFPDGKVFMESNCTFRDVVSASNDKTIMTDHIADANKKAPLAEQLET